MPDNHKIDGVNGPLRDRAAEEMERFRRALDAAVASPTPQCLDALRETADRLMRAVGRVLIEIGRLREHNST